MNAVTDIIRAEVAKRGVISFARFMQLALYCPVCGFYEKENDTPGRRGDYYTSVSVGSLFGELLALQFARWIEGFPTPKIVEAGAHDGRLAADILRWFQSHCPELARRLQYWIIEPSPRRQGWQREALRAFDFQVRWADQLAVVSEGHAAKLHGIIFANELLDAMPVHRLGWDAQRGRWFEWGVALEGDKFVWTRMPDSSLAENEADAIHSSHSTPLNSGASHLPVLSPAPSEGEGGCGPGEGRVDDEFRRSAIANSRHETAVAGNTGFQTGALASWSKAHTERHGLAAKYVTGRADRKVGVTSRMVHGEPKDSWVQGATGGSMAQEAILASEALHSLPSVAIDVPADLLTVLPDGFTTEVCPAAQQWWREAANHLERGRLLTLDYGLSAADFFAPERQAGTLRAYHRHRLVTDVLARPGEQDLTAHVNFSALQAQGEQSGLRTEYFDTQARFLTDVAAHAWKPESGFGPWTARHTRQFQTLTHPELMGRAFRVLIQSR